jgi:phosphopentomutase
MKVILLVLDGLGIGEMPDVALVRPEDRGANTLKRILESANPPRMENLRRLGLAHILAADGQGAAGPAPLASYGRSRLAHTGADSYLGHQEILGTIPRPPVKTMMKQADVMLDAKLTQAGHRVSRPLPGQELLLVDDCVIIGDNLEADPGLIINLTVATDLVPWEDALKIGQIVRSSVENSRVIVFGGPGIDVGDILRHTRRVDNGQLGVDSPALGVYNEHLFVQHMGYGIDPARQAPHILSERGVPVVLIGKMADLVVCPRATRDSVVPTGQLMETVIGFVRNMPDLFLAGTVQETDLAAHEGDLTRLAGVVDTFDRALGVLLTELTEEDVLFICADHGNDPCVNVGRHTREETPLLVYQKGQPSGHLGARGSLADIGATITHLYHSPSTQDGTIISYGRAP